MKSELQPRPLDEELQRRRAEQGELTKKYDSATPNHSYLKVIGVDGRHRIVLGFGMDAQAFYANHMPTKLLGSWPATTRPSELRNAIMRWMDGIEEEFPGYNRLRFSITKD